MKRHEIKFERVLKLNYMKEVCKYELFAMLRGLLTFLFALLPLINENEEWHKTEKRK